MVEQHGEIVAERYGTQPANLFEPEERADDAATPLISWSIAKSMAHAALGLLVDDGRLDPLDPAPVPEWQGTDKEAITVLDLLEMRSGLAFVEDYVDGESSDVIDMLFGSGSADHAAFAAAKPLLHPPGTVWSYSSGTTNILSRIIGDVVAGDAAVRRPRGRRRCGRSSTSACSARSGCPTPIPASTRPARGSASSYVHAPARQFARFGELYLRDGWPARCGCSRRDGRPRPHGRRPRPRDRLRLRPPLVDVARPAGIARRPRLRGPVRRSCCPSTTPSLVHLGKTDATVRDRLVARLRRLVAAL